MCIGSQVFVEPQNVKIELTNVLESNKIFK